MRLGVSRSPGYAGASVAVLASLVRDDPLLLVTDVALPAVPEECELVIRLERDAVWPRFAIVRRGTEDVLAEFSLDRVSESALGAFLREETRGISARDVDGMQAERSPHPLLEQLRIGDCVRLRSRALHGAVPSDQVLRIRECREIRTGETRTQRGQAIPGFVLSSYMMRFETVARDGTAASSVDLQACYQNVDGEIVTS
ncbi:MAG TPA: hypothetical protein VHF22_02375 [Planctomycetota bacterium]|nr:hypothetical protein [Planctomycetota bacterium]